MFALVCVEVTAGGVDAFDEHRLSHLRDRQHRVDLRRGTERQQRGQLSGAEALFRKPDRVGARRQARQRVDAVAHRSRRFARLAAPAT